MPAGVVFVSHWHPQTGRSQESRINIKQIDDALRADAGKAGWLAAAKRRRKVAPDACLATIIGNRVADRQSGRDTRELKALSDSLFSVASANRDFHAAAAVLLWPRDDWAGPMS